MFKGKCIIIPIPFAIHSQPRFLIEVFGVVLIAAQLDAQAVKPSAVQRNFFIQIFRHVRSLPSPIFSYINIYAQK